MQYAVIESNLARHSIWNNPAAKRAWILQEWLLAPRVLHFGAQQLLWECREHQKCERYPSGYPDHNSRNRFKTDHDHMSYQSERPQDKLLLGIDRWARLIRTYTSMSLTSPGDKLIALSGIAKQVGEVLDDAYVAGMWRKRLPLQLLWFNGAPTLSKRSETQSGRPTAYRAPTWSWASAEGSVMYNSAAEQNNILFQVQGVHVEHATEDTTGAVIGGWLQLRVSLRPVRIMLHRDTTGGGEHNLRYWFVLVADIDLQLHIMLDTPLSNEDAFDNDNAQGKIYCMPASKTRQGNFADFLLLRVVDTHGGIFERIGYGHSGSEGMGDKARYDILLVELDEGEKKTFPCVRYEDGRHVIRTI